MRIKDIDLDDIVGKVFCYLRIVSWNFTSMYANKIFLFFKRTSVFVRD